MANSTALRLLAGLFCALGPTIAAGADLPVKAPMLAAPVVYNWTGVYVGGHAGYGGGMKDWGAIEFDYPAKGALAGLQVGINQQIGNWVIGLEGDFSWADIKGTQALTLGAPAVNFLETAGGTSRIDRLSTVAGRLGFAADRWLVYVKGGAVWAHENHSLSAAVAVTTPPQSVVLLESGSETRFGPMVGLGAEYAFLGNWSAKIEYDFLDLRATGPVPLLGTVTTNGVTTPIAQASDIAQAIHLAKVGLNYRFGPDAPPPIAPSPPVAGFNWTGAYVGAQAAYGFGPKRWVNSAPLGQYNVKGGLGGGTVGANAQAGVFVAGVEGEWMGGRLSGSQNLAQTSAGGAITQTNDFSTSMDWLALVTGRAGFVAADRWLVYGKAGLTLAHENHASNTALFATGVGSAVTSLAGDALHTGLVAGAGVEYAFSGNWSAKLEYDYTRFRGQRVVLSGLQAANIPGTLVGTFANVAQSTIEQELHLVKFGVNYHFAPDQGVVTARY